MTNQPFPVPPVSKPWYRSSLVWAGIITALLSVLPLVQAFLTHGVYDPAAIIGLVSGILTVALRFTSSGVPIQGGSQEPKP